MPTEDELKQAELNKLVAETRKADAEAAKYEAEKKETEKPYYKTSKFLQVVITALLGIPVLLGLFEFIIRPFYDKEVIKAEAQIANKDLDLAIKRKEVDSINFNISKMNLTIKQNKDSIKLLFGRLDDTKKQIVIKNNVLQKKEMTLKQRLKDLINQKKQTIEIINQELNLLEKDPGVGRFLLMTVYFNYDRYNLKPSFYKKLDNLADFMNKNPAYILSLEGHAFEQVGTAAYNLRLSKDRANSVKTYLVGSGLAANRIRVKGFGESGPNALTTNILDKQINKKLYELRSTVEIILN